MKKASGKGYTYVDAVTVICDLEQLEASVFDQDLDRSGPCIYRVFNQLLQSMHRGDNNLPCRNFIDYIRIQSLKIRSASQYNSFSR